ncbi:MAG: hypothetical protein ACFE9R_14230 [Candidatus Hermodarchaeota archaeon]
MVKKRILYLIGFLFGITLLSSIGQAQAHNPSSMILVYNSSSETLSVTITHTSANFNTHYIFEVIGTVNGSLAINGSYTSQPSNTFTYNYNLTASAGDTIEVTARCTQAGIITRSITVGQPNDAIDGFFAFWVVIGVSAITMIIIINKKLKK